MLKCRYRRRRTQEQLTFHRRNTHFSIHFYLVKSMPLTRWLVGTSGSESKNNYFGHPDCDHLTVEITLGGSIYIFA